MRSHIRYSLLRKSSARITDTEVVTGGTWVSCKYFTAGANNQRFIRESEQVMQEVIADPTWSLLSKPLMKHTVQISPLASCSTIECLEPHGIGSFRGRYQHHLSRRLYEVRSMGEDSRLVALASRARTHQDQDCVLPTMIRDLISGAKMMAGAFISEV